MNHYSPMEHYSLNWPVIWAMVTLLLMPTAQAATYYVDDDVSGGDGSSWANAYQHLQDALAVAVAGDEIHVAAGTYYPDEGGGQSNNDRFATFQLRSGVAIYGGHGGESILSGDIDQNDPDNSGNSYHVVTAIGTNSAALLDGFTIRGGNANDDAEDSPHGRGGGLHNASSSVTLSNLVFTENWGNQGGGMVNIGGGNPNLTNVVFRVNTGRFGGGMYNGSTRPAAVNLRNVVFENNSATHGSGMFNTLSIVNLSSVTFNANIDGSAMENLSTEGSFRDVVFSNNSSPFNGGGMINFLSAPILTNVTFDTNRAHLRGGGMFNIQSSPRLQNVVFWSNVATLGGGMYNIGSRPVLNHVTFSLNQVLDDGGAMVNSDSYPAIANSILWNNIDANGSPVPPIHNINGSTPSVIYSVIQGGHTGFGSGVGNSTDDPLFADAANGDLRPIIISPAINAGRNESIPSGLDVDLEGNPRISDSIVDMGAYEHQGSTVALSITPRPELGTVSGDLLNCGINGSDCVAEYPVDTTVNLIAEGRPGYAFDAWSGGCSNSFIPAGNMSCSASFTPTCYSGNSILFVDDNAVGNETGEDWANAMTTLQDALDFADNCPNINEIRVAEGIYYPDEGVGGAYEDNNLISFTLSSNLAIYGGYPDGGGTRDWVSHVTVLSGNIQQNNTNNASHVVDFPSSADSSAVLDGFTITGAKPNLSFVPGAGIKNAGSPILRNLLITGNSGGFGAGLENTGSPVLSNVVFSGNSSNLGGAVNNNGGSPVFDNVTFQGNSASQSGGGVYNSAGVLTLNNSILWGNTADEGAQIFVSDGTVTVTHSLVQGGYGGTGNLSADPAFVNAPAGNLRLQATSPAIDAGDSSLVSDTLDLAANPRIAGCEVDMGAYENQSAVCSSSILSFTPPRNGTVTTFRTVGGVPAAGEITCGSTGNLCSERFSDGTSLTLIPTPDEGFSFVAWGGDCTGTGLVLDEDAHCTARFMGSQSISFSPPSGDIFGGNDTLSASASSGLSVSFASTTPEVCGVTANTVFYYASGTCTITADQAGDDDYFPAPQVSADITVSQANQTITLILPVMALMGGTGTVDVAASSGLPVSLDTTTPGVCSVVGTTVSYLAVGSCTIAADQAGDANHQPAPRVSATLTVESPLIFKNGFEAP